MLTSRHSIWKWNDILQHFYIARTKIFNNLLRADRVILNSIAHCEKKS